MKPSKPPSLATWLLKHCTDQSESESLLGDLSEEFSQGRSTRWYWYQVFVAIFVSGSRSLCAGWASMLFALIISAALPYKQIWQSSEYEHFFGWGIQLPFPVSLLVSVGFWSEFDAVIFLAVFTSFLTIKRHLTRASIAKATSIEIVTLIFGNLALHVLQAAQPPRFVFYQVVWATAYLLQPLPSDVDPAS